MPLLSVALDSASFVAPVCARTGVPGHALSACWPTVASGHWCTCRVLPLTDETASRFHELRATHRRVGTKDMRMASIALGSGGILVNRDASDFSAIEGMALKDLGA